MANISVLSVVIFFYVSVFEIQHLKQYLFINVNFIWCNVFFLKKRHKHIGIQNIVDNHI